MNSAELDRCRASGFNRFPDAADFPSAKVFPTAKSAAATYQFPLASQYRPTYLATVSAQTDQPLAKILSIDFTLRNF